MVTRGRARTRWFAHARATSLLVLVIGVGPVERGAAASEPNRSPAGADDRLAREQRARALHKKGLADYNGDRLDDAIAAFKQAYSIFPAPGFLFNIAQAYERKGDCASALQFYTDAMNAGPSGENRVRVETRIAQMEQCVARERERSTPAPPPPAAQGETAVPASVEAPPVRRADAAAPARSPTLWGPVLLGTGGLVAAGIGAGVLFSVASEVHDLEPECMQRCPPERADPLRVRAAVGYGLVGAGAVTLTSAIVWWIMRRSDARASIAPTASGVVAGGRF